ncbi:hypothetical protein CNEO4_960013 [Clostridium neonatale]|nr:hypothetical protein CNEO2_290012 [Clostridium neonatale]CAI3670763.1 hypothetical protein CNEO3_940009 [Clostridium neonatale]CAI3729994.1 hypothetical protein CNEO4_960013 [Clostridium neonatale]CAI3730435.1 hypothetical protein CNEO3_930009 [Clostridium neonatale]CAI3734552.1 hypothetical protein CNEO3_960009 [Clostridium neonatale]
MYKTILTFRLIREVFIKNECPMNNSHGALKILSLYFNINNF